VSRALAAATGSAPPADTAAAVNATFESLQSNVRGARQAERAQARAEEAHSAACTFKPVLVAERALQQRKHRHTANSGTATATAVAAAAGASSASADVHAADSGQLVGAAAGATAASGAGASSSGGSSDPYGAGNKYRLPIHEPWRIAEDLKARSEERAARMAAAQAEREVYYITLLLVLLLLLLIKVLLLLLH
jgi:cobalamin biosynthesis Mg chelatase CobN